MFNKQELEYLYMAVNMLPPPNTTQGGKAKAHMIAKLCDLMDQVDAEAQKAQADADPALSQDVADIQERQKARSK